MTQEERTADLGLPGVTVTKYLFRIPLYKGDVGFVVEDPLSDPTVSGSLSLVPERRGLPVFSAEATKTPDGGSTASFGVRHEDIPVRYSREYRNGDMSSTRDIVQGGLGPFSGFYSELKGGGEKDLVEKAFGASAQVGPLSFFGEQSDASWEGRDPQTGRLLRNMAYAKDLENTRTDERNRKIRAEIEVLFGKGVAGLEVAREYMSWLPPNWMGQPRPTVSAPHTTNLGAHWQGPLGPGRLGLQGDVTSERGWGTSSNLGADYVIEDPLGLGGRFNAYAGWGNPYGGPSNWQAGVRYGLTW